METLLDIDMCVCIFHHTEFDLVLFSFESLAVVVPHTYIQGFDTFFALLVIGRSVLPVVLAHKA